MNLMIWKPALTSLQDRYGHFVVPLYKGIGTDAIAHEGSAVLVKFRGRYLMLTADHAQKKCRPLYLPGTTFQRIAGEVYTQGDPIDLAYVELT